MSEPVVADRGHRGVYVVAVMVLAALTLFAPARLIYKANQETKAGAQEIVIQGFAFNPTSITVPAGTTITFRNADGAAHTVTAEDGSFDSGRIPGGGTFEVVVNANVAFHCDFHGSMTGVIVVEG